MQPRPGSRPHLPRVVDLRAAHEHLRDCAGSSSSSPPDVSEGAWALNSASDTADIMAATDQNLILEDVLEPDSRPTVECAWYSLAALDDRLQYERYNWDVDAWTGIALASGDLDGEGHDNLVTGALARNEGDEDYQKGGTYVYFGPLDEVAYGVPDAQMSLLGDEDNDRFGGEMEAGEDINGDGQAELLIGGQSRYLFLFDITSTMSY